VRKQSKIDVFLDPKNSLRIPSLGRTRAKTSGCDQWQARLLGGGEGFIELAVCDARSGRSVGLPFVWLVYGFICELVKILHLGRNSSLFARCILMKKAKIFACVCLLAAEGMSNFVMLGEKLCICCLL
jgi:hypothetical protein